MCAGKLSVASTISVSVTVGTPSTSAIEFHQHWNGVYYARRERCVVLNVIRAYTCPIWMGLVSPVIKIFIHIYKRENSETIFMADNIYEPIRIYESKSCVFYLFSRCGCFTTQNANFRPTNTQTRRPPSTVATKC